MKLAKIFGALLLLVLVGCKAPPIGADRVTARTSYAQIEANALSSGKPSSHTLQILHRYNLDLILKRDAAHVVQDLYHRALVTHDRDVLFALAEMSYFAGERIRTALKPWDQRDPREYYLGAAVYAYLYLFDKGYGESPSPFDGRFRAACDLYNYGLAGALTDSQYTNGTILLVNGKRKLPVGEIDINFRPAGSPSPMDQYDKFLTTDLYKVRGLSVRNRERGIGAPLIAEAKIDEALRMRRSAPATAFLRLGGSLADTGAGKATADLELYAGWGSASTVQVNGITVPLEMDLTTPRAYTLNQSFAWQAQKLQFFSPSKGLATQIILTQPYEAGRIPLVLVHGTFSSPVWWGEMLNTLNADATIRQKYQIWLALYSSSNPILFSAADLREQLSATIQKLDPEGKDRALQQMVVAGHSQGGLLTKLTATDTGDKLWRIVSEKPLEELEMSDKKRADIRRIAFVKPLPFVSRVIFISTPHRGSYLSKGFARRWAQRLVSLPSEISQKSADILTGTEGIEMPKAFRSTKGGTSLDGMSPKNPLLLALAKIPVTPTVTAHSIIPVKGDGDFRVGKDGVVAYQSAHVDYVESELIVRGTHSCQGTPQAIEEVRRILHEHLGSLRNPVAQNNPPSE